MGFSAKTAIDRSDFGLKFNMPLEGGGVVVGDRVEIVLEIEAVKEIPAVQAA
jgi:polyisoprenoid-binding protein YceI